MAKVIFLLLILITVGNNTLVENNTNSQCYSAEGSSKIIEKVYLHIDRDIYSPGDDLWFKGYLIDAPTRILTSHSNNLHVELISPDSKIIDSRIIRINEGLGNGDFQLSKTLRSGKYRLRAYTNYMRNFGDQQFFSKEISVINPSDADKIFSDSTGEYQGNKLEVSFFPEGGSLVEDVPSVVGFKAVNNSGEGCDVTGELHSNTGELISTFKSAHKGMGTFSIIPKSGVAYYAIAKSPDGSEVKSDIPECFPTGVVINISKNQTNEVGVAIRTNPKTLPLFLDHDLSLTISSPNVSYSTTTFRMKSLNNFLVLPTENIPDGIVMLTLSETGKKPLCERLVFIQNNDDIKINLETNKTVYKQRDSVSVRISMTDNYALAPEAYISLSAAEEVSAKAQSPFPSTISSWFLLESDIHGQVEEPSSYFDLSNPDRLKELDLLLLTQGWRDFEWKYKEMINPPENGFTISGRARKKFADVSLINSNVTIGIFQTGNPFTRIVSTDSSGRFSLNVVDLNGKPRMIASISDDKDNLKGMLVLDTLRYSPAIVNKLTYKVQSIMSDEPKQINKQPIMDSQLNRETIRSFITHSEINNSIKRKYKLSDTINIGEVNIIATKRDDPQTAHLKSSRTLYNTPDIELIVTPQMQHYSNLQQLVRSQIPRTTPRKLGAGPGAATFFTNPLYMLDGMRADPEMIFSLPINSIERIDVLYDQASYAVYGSFGAVSPSKPPDGAINFITRVGKVLSKSTNFYTADQQISGYNEARIFYSPKHHATLESDYKPDLRTTLFWEPNLKLENNKDVYLNFYNSDNSSAIKINVEGITTTGIPVTGFVIYKVQ